MNTICKLKVQNFQGMIISVPTSEDLPSGFIIHLVEMNLERLIISGSIP